MVQAEQNKIWMKHILLCLRSSKSKQEMARNLSAFDQELGLSFCQNLDGSSC